jgi:3-oxoacyl-[acyl-carrier protein] reductase
MVVNCSSDRETAERGDAHLPSELGERELYQPTQQELATLLREREYVDFAFGTLNVLVNNPGVFRFGVFAEITEASRQIHYDSNVLGTDSHCAGSV